jgi:hypothetical protein
MDTQPKQATAAGGKEVRAEREGGEGEEAGKQTRALLAHSLACSLLSNSQQPALSKLEEEQELKEVSKQGGECGVTTAHVCQHAGGQHHPGHLEGQHVGHDAAWHEAHKSEHETQVTKVRKREEGRNTLAIEGKRRAKQELTTRS